MEKQSTALYFRISKSLRNKVTQKSKEAGVTVSEVLRASMKEILQKDEEEIRELVERGA